MLVAEGNALVVGELPVGAVGGGGVGWWGMGMLIVSEAALFGFLLFAYFYLGATAEPGFRLDGGPDLPVALANIALLLASSVVAWWAERGLAVGRRMQAIAGLAATLVMGAAFVGVQVYEWRTVPYRLGTSTFASLYFTTTGLHVAHVVAGLLILAALLVWTASDYFSPRRRFAVSGGIYYWHFVNAVGVCVFATYHLTPYFGFGA